MKSKQLKSYNIPTNDPFMDAIDAKPVGLMIIAIFFGALLLVTGASRIFGFTLILFATFCLLFLPQDILVYFFREYLILYNKADRSKCSLIYYDEVSSWYYSWSAAKDYLYIELIDGSVEKIEAFSRGMFEFKMRMFLKDKQKKVTR